MATSTRRTTTTVRTASLFAVSQDSFQDNLLTDLFTAYYCARNNKRNTFAQVKFERNLSDNLMELYEDIRQYRYRVGRSMCFIINDPVKREVFAASFRDRIVHHLLFNYLSPIFEKKFIYDSYSCRKGKGTHFGVKRLDHHIKSCSYNYTRPCYVLKLDISGYFMSINRQLLFDMVMKEVSKSEIQNKRLVEYLLKQVIFNEPTRGCRIKGSIEDWKELPDSKSLFHSPKGCGLPIGNLTSQLFSNIYLSPLDEFVKRELNITHYGRYVDDFYLVSNEKQILLKAIPRIREFLCSSLKLNLHPHKIYLQECRKGVRFLGRYIKPNDITYATNSRKRLENNICRAMSYVDDPFVAHSIISSCSQTPMVVQ